MRGDGSETPTGPGRNSGISLALRVEQLLPYAGPALIVIAGAIVLAWSWEYGPDVLIDFGRELYVPWRITEGARLYTDVLYLNGPLSPHFNAFFFLLFGEGLRVLMAVNAVIAGCIVALVYALLNRAADRLTATVGGLAFVCFIAFTQLGTMGNYNFLTPYSHEVSHGIALALLSLWAFSLKRRHGEKALFAAGFALGLVFLTKVEVSLAAAGGLGLGVVLGLSARTNPPGTALRQVSILAASTALPVLLAFVALLLVIPAGAAAHGLVDPFVFVFNQEVTSLEFYRWVRGTDQLAMNLDRMLLWLTRYAMFAAPIAVLAFILPARTALRNLVAFATFVLLAVSLGPGPYIELLADAFGSPARALRINEWPHATRGFPPLLLVMLGIAFLAWLKERRKGTDTTVAILRVSLIAFALLLLAKIVLNVRLHHYGFALTFPALLVFVAALLCWIPRIIDHYGGAGSVFRAAGLALMLVATVDLLRIVDLQYENNRFEIGSGVDYFRAGAKAPYASRVLQDFEERIKPGETLAVLPEGVMLNYLARRSSSTAHTNFMPPEMILYGEERILADFKKSPPDYVALVHKDTTEYGFPLFGKDYGTLLYAWINANYEPVRLIGRRPLKQKNQFGIEIRRRSEATDQSSSTGG